VVVGFSRLRKTMFREKVAWAAKMVQEGRLARPLPRRIAMYDLEAGQLCWEQNLEDFGMSAIFSIHTAPHA
jgi:hypothetical protein